MKRTITLLSVAIAVITASATPGISHASGSFSLMVPETSAINNADEASVFDNTAIKCAKWLLATPLTDGTVDDEASSFVASREEIGNFMVTWMDATDRIALDFGPEIIPLLDNRDVLIAYLAAAVIYATNHHSPEYTRQLQAYAMNYALTYYQDNKAQTGEIESLEMLNNLRSQGQLNVFFDNISPLFSSHISNFENNLQKY